MQRLSSRRAFLLGLATAITAGASATAIALAMWSVSPPPNARELRAVLKDIDNYATTNGTYPTSWTKFASFSALTQHYGVYLGEWATNGITWQPYKVSSHDLTVMVDQDGYEIFLPVGRMKPVSFSSFPVWRYDSAKHHWEKGRIHWSVAGSYWSGD